MKKTPGGWTVVDHDAGVLMRTYTFNSAGASANCFVGRLADGKLAVISPPVGVDETGFKELEAYGEVGALIANTGFHHLGQPEWRKRYPKARCFASPGASKRIAKKGPAAGRFEPLSDLTALLGPDFIIREAPSEKAGECWAFAKTSDGYAWYASDVLANFDKLPGNLIIRTMFKLTKSAPGLRVFGLSLKFTVKDRARVFRDFLSDLEAHPPSILVLGHGEELVGADVAERATAAVRAGL